jgi:hypothetical protein
MSTPLPHDDGYAHTNRNGKLRLGLYDNGTSTILDTWGIKKSQVSNAQPWIQRVMEVCDNDSDWTVLDSGTGKHAGGFLCRQICVDDMTVKEMCDIIKQFM